MSHSYFIFYKPYGILSQFSNEGKNPGLGSLISLPKDVYPLGRLDADSEGLLILSNDKALNTRLLNPIFKHKREYWVQVENIPSAESLQKLESGVQITIDGKAYQTMPCTATLMETEPDIPARTPPIRERKSIPTAWLSLKLIEGKNRQVRKMTAAVGHPTLRLLRYAMEGLTLMDMQPGELREISYQNIKRALKF